LQPEILDSPDLSEKINRSYIQGCRKKLKVQIQQLLCSLYFFVSFLIKQKRKAKMKTHLKRLKQGISMLLAWLVV